jgi:NAD(P)-dependent dehydrogenase (short-subunit alcohol dehydrogenase family)
MSELQLQRFTGRNVIVTGPGKDIGRATARRFAAEGADVMLIGRTAWTLEETQAMIADAGGRSWVHVADVRKRADIDGAVDAAIERWGRIDVLINNAGDRDDCPFLEMTEERWDEVFATNLKGPFLLSQGVAREMVKTGGGVILHNASIDSGGGDGTFASYNASKAGLLGLNRTMAIELAPHGVRVNCVSPGYTESTNLAFFVGADVAEYLKSSFDRVPMKRMVLTDEVAGAFAFLASDDATGITGTELKVDCGLTSNLYVLETMPTAEDMARKRAGGVGAATG